MNSKIRMGMAAAAALSFAHAWAGEDSGAASDATPAVDAAPADATPSSSDAAQGGTGSSAAAPASAAASDAAPTDAQAKPQVAAAPAQPQGMSDEDLQRIWSGP